MPSPSSPFSTKTFAFLRDLAADNRREWFQANRDRYEEHVRQPALQFIAGFARPLERISGEFVADPRPMGGSLFRIHRDTRFARDKCPYKPFIGIHFRHAQAKDLHAPGFYLHLEPRKSFAGVGIWHPDGPTLLRIRTAIAADPQAWKRTSTAKGFRAQFELSGDSLKRAPKGFDPEHPLIDDLRRKDFVGVQALDQKAIVGPNLSRDLAAAFRAGAPFVKYLCSAIDVPF